jgi:hypothetical protein
VARQPKGFTDLGKLATADVSEAVAENFFAGAIQQDDAAVHVRGNQAAAHRVDNVFGEILEVQQLFTFFLELQALAPQGLGEEASEIRNAEETE